MNTLYFTYALEVEKTASITQAADNLFMSQPTLSKAIKDLEANLGFAVFRRTSKGVIPTQKGTEFLEHAKKIVAQLEKMELALQSQEPSHQLYSLAVPRCDSASKAVANYLCTFDSNRKMEFDIRQTNSLRILEAVADGRNVLGIIRYHTEDEEYFLKYLAEKGLQYENLWQGEYRLLLRSGHPLAQKPKLTMEDLRPYIEVVFADEEVPYLRLSSAPMASNPGGKQIRVCDRGMQMDMLRINPLAYVWSSPVSADTLEREGLVQRRCAGAGRFKELLISRAGYHISRLDQAFLHELSRQREALL